MTWATARIRQDQEIELADSLALAALRRDLNRRGVTTPIIMTLESSLCHVDLGLVGDLGFVQGQSPNGDPPYRVSVGDSSADGVVAFLHCGDHHTEIPVRHLVSVGDAWAAAKALLDAGIYTQSISWEDV